LEDKDIQVNINSRVSETVEKVSKEISCNQRSSIVIMQIKIVSKADQATLCLLTSSFSFKLKEIKIHDLTKKLLYKLFTYTKPSVEA
jgi:hypothetical protein